MRTGLPIGFLVLFLLLALAGAAWLLSSLDAVSIGVHGWIALILGVVFSLGVGGGLMALVFISSRRGHDEKVHEVRPDNQA
ncbi:MAG: hypothetical protein FJX60_18825 [Alphaproteobacteria bacterium]|nr:hypothetical protein [Alphaproteobacteria bacterium]